ncbi:MAG: hypothetical protein KF873_01785 [Gemmataceae bacterium]|nr:hypothetical protein [Planctomycetia bacterium]MBX3397446.1 hypothetical protein [Gemmataceae bacterium]
MISLGTRLRDGTFHYEAFLVDTGSDDVILPLYFASLLGIDLNRAKAFHHGLADSSRMTVRYADVEFRLATTPFHYVQWRATVGFAAMPRPIFGWAGGLEYFNANFDWMLARMTLVPLPTLPLTASAFPSPDRTRQLPM